MSPRDQETLAAQTRGRRTVSARRWKRIRILQLLHEEWRLAAVAAAVGTYPREVRRVGWRYLERGLLAALSEPIGTLRAVETAGDYTSRLALQEEFKTLPLGAVWDYYCETRNTPAGSCWISEVKRYESEELSKRT